MAVEDRQPVRLSLPPLLAEKLRASPSNILVTGGSGWIGQAVLEMLESAFGEDIFMRVSVFGSRNRNLRLRSGRILLCRALPDIRSIGKGPKLFIHCAFLTKERVADQGLESFVAANRNITDLVTGAMETSDVRGLFTLSSGAVYKKGTRSLDDDAQNNAYGVLKLADEKHFTELAAKKKSPICMPRLFNLSGPFINKLETYALSSMIKAVLGDRPIAIHAPHHVIRSYTHVGDLVTLALAMLLEPKAREPAIFDTAGEDVVEIGDLAIHIGQALGRPGYVIQRPPLIKGSDDMYVGDAEVMHGLLRDRGLPMCSLHNQIRDTADFMRTLAPEASPTRNA